METSGVLFLGVLLASLVGSLHCAGMCGGLVAFVAGSAPPEARFRVHLAYHGGRLLSYSLLGGISGAIGSALDLGGSSIGVKEGAALFAGVFMVLFGFAALLRARGTRLRLPPLPTPLRSFHARITRSTMVRPPLWRAGILGLLTAFLPCGWLYAYVLTAASTGEPASGVLVMVLFWLGTVPVLAALGAGVQRLSTSLRRQLPTLTALLLMALGLFTVASRLAKPDYRARVAQELGQDPGGNPAGLPRRAPCCEGD